jgi:hypothetical protein
MNHALSHSLQQQIATVAAGTADAVQSNSTSKQARQAESPAPRHYNQLHAELRTQARLSVSTELRRWMQLIVVHTAVVPH